MNVHSESCKLVEDLWDDLAAAPEEFPVHDWQKEVHKEFRRALIRRFPSEALR